MELLLGSHVREHGNRVGRLAGFELEPATHRIRQILFSENGELGPQAITRPLVAISHVHDSGEIELRVDVDGGAPPGASGVVLLSRATRLKRAGRDEGPLTGAEINPADREVLSVFAQPHWWSRRISIGGAEVDCSKPGEIRAAAPRDARPA